MPADSIACFLSWTWSAPGKLDTLTFFSSFPLTQPLQGLCTHRQSSVLHVWGPKYPEGSQSLGAAPCKLNWSRHASELALWFKTLNTNSRLLNLKIVPGLLLSYFPRCGSDTTQWSYTSAFCRAERKHQDKITPSDVTFAGWWHSMCLGCPVILGSRAWMPDAGPSSGAHRPWWLPALPPQPWEGCQRAVLSRETQSSEGTELPRNLKWRTSVRTVWVPRLLFFC